MYEDIQIMAGQFQAILYEASLLHQIENNLKNAIGTPKEDNLNINENHEHRNKVDYGEGLRSTYWNHNVAVEIHQKLRDLGSIWNDLKQMMKKKDKKLKESIQKGLKKIKEEEEWTKVQRNFSKCHGTAWKADRSMKMCVMWMNMEM